MEAEDFIFRIFKEVFQISDWKYLFCVQQEVFGVFVFLYLVPSWYNLLKV